jgi:hypothetical protein
MKTGVIVYVTGAQTRDDDFDEAKAARGLDVKADRVAFVFSDEGEESLVLAWTEMTLKGMGQIQCLAGEPVQSSLVRLTGRQLQLRGVS